MVPKKYQVIVSLALKLFGKCSGRDSNMPDAWLRCFDLKLWRLLVNSLSQRTWQSNCFDRLVDHGVLPKCNTEFQLVSDLALQRFQGGCTDESRKRTFNKDCWRFASEAARPRRTTDTAEEIIVRWLNVKPPPMANERDVRVIAD